MPRPELPEPALAHQGGGNWDEMLIIAVPIAAFLVFRWIAGRRERREDSDDSGPQA